MVVNFLINMLSVAYYLLILSCNNLNLKPIYKTLKGVIREGKYLEQIYDFRNH